MKMSFIYEFKFIQAILDFFNFLKFRKQISKEKNNLNSLFNKYEIQRNWLGNILYTQLNFEESDLMNYDYDYDRLIKSKLSNIVTYLSSTLGWGDYLTPQISNFVDEEGNPTLSYGVLFVFTGYTLTLGKFLKFLILFIIIISCLWYFL